MNEDLAKLKKDLAFIKFCVLVLIIISASLCAYVFDHHFDVKRNGGFRPEFAREASELLGQGKYVEVVALANQILETKPRDPYALWYLGIGHYYSGSMQEAIDSLEKTISIAPVWRERAQAYIEEAKTRLVTNSQQTGDELAVPDDSQP